jgi:rhodanese-related sulfurtransferase
MVLARLGSATPVADRPTIHAHLARTRARLQRLTAAEAHACAQDGAVLIDIRTTEQRRAAGVIPGALWFPRNVLEWRVDPASSHVHPRLGDPDRQLVLFCVQGYASSLAAAGLLDIGFANATDLVGGFESWEQSGFPVEPFDERHLEEG